MSLSGVYLAFMCLSAMELVELMRPHRKLIRRTLSPPMSERFLLGRSDAVIQNDGVQLSASSNLWSSAGIGIRQF